MGGGRGRWAGRDRGRLSSGVARMAPWGRLVWVGVHVTLGHSRFVSVVWASVAIGFPVLSTDRFHIDIEFAQLAREARWRGAAWWVLLAFAGPYHNSFRCPLDFLRHLLPPGLAKLARLELRASACQTRRTGKSRGIAGPSAGPMSLRGRRAGTQVSHHHGPSKASVGTPTGALGRDQSRRSEGALFA